MEYLHHWIQEEVKDRKIVEIAGLFHDEVDMEPMLRKPEGPWMLECGHDVQALIDRTFPERFR